MFGPRSADHLGRDSRKSRNRICQSVSPSVPQFSGGFASAPRLQVPKATLGGASASHDLASEANSGAEQRKNEGTVASESDKEAADTRLDGRVIDGSEYRRVRRCDFSAGPR